MRALPYKHRSGLRYFIPSPPFSLHTLVYLALFLYAGFASQTSGLCSAILLAPFNLHAMLHSAIFLYACFLPQKHRNFLSHAHCHITCRMITLAYCGMLTFRLGVVTAVCTGCTRKFPQRVVHLRRFSIWEKEEEGRSLITTVISINSLLCLLKSAIFLTKCNFIRFWFIGNLNNIPDYVPAHLNGTREAQEASRARI